MSLNAREEVVLQPGRKLTILSPIINSLKISELLITSHGNYSYGANNITQAIIDNLPTLEDNCTITESQTATSHYSELISIPEGELPKDTDDAPPAYEEATRRKTVTAKD